MAEYIQKSEVLEVLCAAPQEWNKDCGISKLEYLKICVKNLPAADVAPVRHGWWIIDREFGNDVMSNEQMVICSECGKGIIWGKQPYCPNCGAKMDGGDEE